MIGTEAWWVALNMTSPVLIGASKAYAHTICQHAQKQMSVLHFRVYTTSVCLFESASIKPASVSAYDVCLWRCRRAEKAKSNQMMARHADIQ